MDPTYRALARFGPVSLFRPGSGWVISSVLEACRGRGYRCVVGSVYPQDAHLHWWRYHAFDVLRRIRPGAIVVLHEGRPERAAVAQALDRLLSVLRLRGYDVTTVSDLVAAGERPGTGSDARCFSSSCQAPNAPDTCRTCRDMPAELRRSMSAQRRALEELRNARAGV